MFSQRVCPDTIMTNTVASYSIRQKKLAEPCLPPLTRQVARSRSLILMENSWMDMDEEEYPELSQWAALAQQQSNLQPSDRGACSLFSVRHRICDTIQPQYTAQAAHIPRDQTNRSILGRRDQISLERAELCPKKQRGSQEQHLRLALPPPCVRTLCSQS